MLKIRKIDKYSPFKKIFKKGDEILSFNGEEAVDILDYLFFEAESVLDIVLNREGKEERLRIEKCEEEEIGLEFVDPNLEPAHCKNKCMFCFVDQLPKNLRKTLYVKDDDFRHSFLSGNYITLTNLGDREIDRIIKRRLSPIFISVHATDGELRKKILSNPSAGGIMDKLKLLTESNIVVNAQLVLMEGVNDGEQLEKTLTDLYSLGENLRSVALVPVGLTAHRTGLSPLKLISKDAGRKILQSSEKFRQKALLERSTRFVFPSDEFYILSNVKLPAFSDYEDFSQIENGVGLVRKFQEEFKEEKKTFPKKHSQKKTIFLTGKSFKPFLEDMLERECLNMEIISPPNTFFGETISVSGLMVARDMLKALENKTYDRVFIPSTTLRELEDVFLDDVTLKEFKKQIKAEVVVSPPEGDKFYQLL